MSDGSTAECDHPGIAPWAASGAGGLLLATLGVTSAHRSNDVVVKTAVEPPAPSQPSAHVEPPAPPTSPEPSTPTQPTQPTQPTEPTEPTPPTGPTAPADPVVPTMPTDPVAPNPPSPPAQPATPIEPTTPPAAVEPPAPPVPPAPPAPLIAAPKLSTSTGTEAINSQAHVDIQLAAPESAWVYRLDGETEWHAGTGTRIDASALPEGMHSLMVAQVDEQGRQGDPASLALRIDTIAPDRPEVVTHNGQAAINAQGSLLVHSLEAGSSWAYRVNGGDWTTGAGNSIAASALGEGVNTVDVRQTDAVGNASAVASIGVSLDSHAPLAPTLVTSTGGVLVGSSGSVVIGDVEAGSQVAVQINGTSVDIGHRSNLGVLMPGFREGINTVTISQTDAAGNTSETTHLSFTRDTRSPDMVQFTKDFGSDRVLNASSDKVTVSGLESGGTWTYRVDGGQWQAGVGDSVAADAFVNLPGAKVVGHDQYGDAVSHVLEVVQIDAAGNASVASSLAVFSYITPPAGV